MRNDHAAEGNGKKAKKGKKGADPAFGHGTGLDRRSAALARGTRTNARRLPTRNMNRGR